MSIVLILFKLAIITVYTKLFYNVYTLKKEDSGYKFELDLISRLEFMAGIGLALVAIISNITPEAYSFTCILCVLSLIIGYFHQKRLILAGNQKVLIKGKIIPIKKIKKLGTSMFSLHVYLKNEAKPLRIYVPLTSNNILKNKIENKIKK